MDRTQIPAPRPEVARDAGLRRASTLTKWVGVGAVALVGALAGFVAQAKPGQSSSTGGAGHGGTRSSSGSGSSAGASVTPNNSGAATSSAGSAAKIAPPPAAPAPAPAPAPASPGVVSSGS